MVTDLVKMSAKGQLVVPEDIREQEGFTTGDRFVPVPVKDGVLFKRVDLENLRAEFERLAKQVQKHFKEKRVTPKTVEEAIRWARQKSS